MDIRTFMKVLRKNKANLSKQQVAMLKGQALSGDIEGAYKGIITLTKSRWVINLNQSSLYAQ